MCSTVCQCLGSLKFDLFFCSSNRHFTFCIPFQIQIVRLKVFKSIGMMEFVVRVDNLYIVIGGCHISEDNILKVHRNYILINFYY